MANPFATGWMTLFEQARRPTKFLQSFFTIKPGNVYNGETVEIDIQRFGEDVAVALRQGKGPNLNDADTVTTKEFTPPKYGEAFPANVADLVSRTAGVDPYTDAYNGYAAKLVRKLMRYFQLGMDKISRAVELQASQILQTGKLTLVDSGGTVYEIDYKPKATHFPTVSTAWSNTASDKLLDLENLAKVIRADGQVNPDTLIFGATAFRHFLADAKVQDALDKRRINIGEVSPRQAQGGATFIGSIWIGSYEFMMWTYPEGYKDPVSGAFTQYVADDKVIMTSTQTRFDRVSALVPLPLGPDPRVAGLMPGRLVSDAMDLDVMPNLWCTPNGKELMAEIESRPLLVPVQIDGFGCLDTNP
jgi:hypothetical protein